jgi:signal transduction histidine kinase
MTNLVSNAIKYSPKGGIVRIGGWVEDDESARPSVKRRVVIYVADQGIGIPVQELPLVFDRFYRVDSTLRRGTAGSGLGLYLTKTIVEAHGGQIWARSEPNKGTTFFFALPFDAMDEIPPDEQAERPHTATPTRSSPPLDTPATKA